MLHHLPRWVEVRSLLLSGSCEVYGHQEAHDLSLVLRDPDAGSIFVVGRPTEAAVEAAVEQNGRSGEVIALHEQAAWLAAVLPGWTRAAIIVQQLNVLYADGNKEPPSDIDPA